ncbi:protein translocase subunit SecD [Kibdelosporangium philippinense]|uniref:Multifunctional fusion protein n=1 Tax=Kibdelosporangium philippinense TaxID=211113 RepID=A0ABS8Z7X9_9PSEU|nr:protein translocase subunit SecD [Kibdelosporangium philippinense]MCE7002905.1 protein translocase subunit SecD [Kibdelosporangium philippinense]
MSRAQARPRMTGRVITCLVVLAAAVYLLLTTAPRLGLDLRGGTQVVLETKAEVDDEATERTLEVLRRRVDALGVAEPMLARSGDNRIIIELPGLQDPKQAVETIGKTAQLAFHSVTGPAEQLGPVALTGEGVEDARHETNPQEGPGWFVSIGFASDATTKWEQLTGQAACFPAGDPRRQVAIVLDGKVISAPQVDVRAQCNVGMIGDRIRITGQFNQAEAKDLALLINAGALPVPVEIVEQRTVGPTLGVAAIEDSVRAAVIGLALTAAFLMIVYWFAGFIAVLALLCYALVSYAALLAIGATLTLPGLAGFVLAIGMAVDATVLVFERVREERDSPLPKAIEKGFKGALSAIVDSNVTTLIAAGLLFLLASGPVQGFGVTLTIGVLAAMFTTLVLTRVLMHFSVSSPKISGLTRDGRVRQWVNRGSPNFLSTPRTWLVAAAAAVLIALAGMIFAGPKLGVEFTGGRVLEYSTSADANQVREAVAEAGFPRTIVQSSGNNTVSVRTEPIDQAAMERIRDAISAKGQATQIRDEQIGPSLGAELRIKALIALGLAVAAQLTYLAIRFDWRLGVAVVAALAQDVVIILGIFAWLGKTMDGVFLAALLTVIGYSVNDSVVVFDRVRELRGKRPKDPFARTVGSAVLQTLPRTVNTGIGVLFVLGALLILGDGSIADFALALLLGLLAGTVSTVATAGPVAILLDRRCPGAARAPKRTGQRVRTGSGAVV